MKINKLSLTSIPAILISIFPVVTCLPCAFSYLSFLSSMGLGFASNTAILNNLTIFLLTLALLSFLYNSIQSKNYNIFAIAIVGACMIIIGRFYIQHNIILYAGNAIFILSSILNMRQKKTCPITSKQDRLKKNIAIYCSIALIISISFYLVQRDRNNIIGKQCVNSHS